MFWNFKKIALALCFCGFVFLVLWPTQNITLAQEQEKKEGPVLEIVYPEIPGVPTPKVVSSGLPEYVRYIFWFAIAIIGLVVLGAFIYSGFEYLTSFGSPEKFTSGKNGMISAGFGAIILLSSVLIFNTINPQLIILNMPDATVLAPIVYDGIYLCNYKADEQKLFNAINRYMNIDDEMGETEEIRNGAREDKIKAAKELRDFMMNKNGSKQCARIEGSGNLKNPFNMGEYTMFIIPRKAYEPDVSGKIKIEWKFDFGIIFHEKDNSRGKCKLKSLYDVEVATPIGSDFTKANSVTLFTKPASEPSSDRKGVILYQCKNYNDKTQCPEGVNNPARASFPSTMPMGWFDEATKGKLGDLAQNTFSIQIDPEGSYFAVLFSEDNYKGDTCEVISSSDPDLTNNSISQSKSPGCFSTTQTSWSGGTTSYKPCLQSMIVIKGKVL